MMNDKQLLEMLSEYLSYDPSSGFFVWRVKRWRVGAGDVAGTIDGDGYIKITLMRKNYKAHRIAWLFYYGHMPEHEIDHINGIRTDNRVANLREATRRENMQNKRAYSNNTSGLMGVGWNKVAKKWVSRIKVDGKAVWLGSYDDKYEAYKAYLDAKKRLHKFHPVQRCVA